MLILDFDISKGVLIFHVVFIGIFATVAMVVINGFFHWILTSKHLQKNYFDLWKLSRGTIKERKSFVLPEDPCFSVISRSMNKINNWIIGLCFIAIVILVIAILILDIGKNQAL